MLKVNYKIVRLKEGTVPSQFPWTVEQSNNEVTELNEINSIGISTSPEITVETNIDSVHDYDSNQLQMDVSSLESTKPLNFDDLNREDLLLPKPWIKQLYNSKKFEGLSFIVINCIKCGSTFRSIVEKEICVRKNMTITVYFSGQPVATEIFGEFPTTIDHFGEFLEKINNFSTCSGSSLLVRNNDSYRNGYQDSTGVWRHNECSIVILGENSKCTHCTTMDNSMKRKRAREVGTKERKRIRLNPITKNDFSVQCLRKKYLAKTKMCKRKNIMVKKLKCQLLKNEHEMDAISEQNLHDILKRTKVPKNQCVAVQQIFDAAKCKSSKGVRYSENWMLLCMLMYMRSPRTYKFIRINRFLPLPCMRTIKRY